MLKAITLGLIGYPLDHSLSPRMHRAALTALGLPGRYDLFPVAPMPGGEAELARLMHLVRSGIINGLNVTIPHKQTVLPWMNELTSQAVGIGAVNTIFLQHGRLTGDNTDAAGFLVDLARHLPARKLGAAGESAPEHFSKPASALVLGAGGSARAVVYALASAGWQIFLASRRLEQAEGLAAWFLGKLPQTLSIRCLPLGPGTPLPHEDIHLIVNTTPAGMTPETHATPWPAGWPFPKQGLLYDLVYNPSITLLMQQAQQAGLVAANGLGMLLEQAALSFECWTGQVAPRDAMVAALFEKF